MWHTKIKFVKLLFLFSIMIGVSGCMSEFDNIGYSKSEYVNAIESSLNKKYGLTFVVESIGGRYGTHDDTTVKAWCYAKDGKYANIQFMAEVGKENLIVTDSYLHLIVSDIISEKIKSYYPDESIVITQFETLSGHSDRIVNESNYREYMNDFRVSFVSSKVFIKNDGDMNGILDKVCGFAKKLEELDYYDFGIVVFVTNDLSDEIIDIFKTNEDAYDYYVESEDVVAYTAFQLNKDGLITSIETIESSLRENK